MNFRVLFKQNRFMTKKPSSIRAFTWWIVGLCCCDVSMMLHAQQGVVVLSLSKATIYYQSNSAAPRLVNSVQNNGALPYYFQATAFGFGVTLQHLNLITPPGDEFSLSSPFVLQPAAETKAKLDEDYPDGAYEATFTFIVDGKSTSDVAQTTIAIQGDLYQTNPPPTFINAANANAYLSQTSTLPVMAAEDLVLAWNEFTNADPADTIDLMVFDTSNPNASVFKAHLSAPNLSPRVIIPAGTLTNQSYEVELLYSRQSTQNSKVITSDNGTNSIWAISSYVTVTRLLLNTTRAVQLRSVPPPAADLFCFQFRALPNQSYQVQSSTNCLAWSALLNTNAATTNVVVQQPVTNRFRFFRVISSLGTPDPS